MQAGHSGDLVGAVSPAAAGIEVDGSEMMVEGDDLALE